MSLSTTFNKFKLLERTGPLAKKMVLYIVLASTLITIFTSAFQLFQIYKTDVSLIHARLNEIRDSYGDNIAARVWVTNQQELTLTLQGILRLPDIEYIEVYEGTELIAQQGLLTDADTIKSTFPLKHTFRKKLLLIGKMHITATLTRTYQHIIDQAIVIIISNGIKTFFIAGFMLYLFYQLVAKHLITLGRFAEIIDLNSLDNQLELKRKKNTEQPDELDQLGNSLTSLQDRLKNSILDLDISQALVKLLLDSTAEAIYGIDTNGECTFANKACLSMLGYNADSELLGENMHQLIHYKYPDGSNYPVDNCHIFKAFKEKIKTHIDDEVLWRKDGSYFEAEYWSYPIFKNNVCVGAVVTFLDITQRIESERALKENENNLEITLNSIGDAVITTDSKGNVRRMNPAAQSLTGWRLNDAMGKPLKDIFNIINSVTRETITNPVDKVISTGKTIHLSNHTTLVSKNGIEYHISDSAAPIRENHTILGMVLVFNDITEQYRLRELANKSKRDLQAIMNHSPAVIYVKDTQGRYTFINSQYENLFHISNDDAMGKTDYELFDKTIADAFQFNDKAVITAGHAIESEEQAPLDDGLHTYVSIKFPLLNENNEIYAICGISTDVTERRQQQEQLQRSQKMEALGKLTGGIAHDYNNILGIVLGYSEQINHFLDDPKMLTKISQSLQNAATRGSKLAKKLQSVSNYNKPPIFSVININTVLQEQYHLLTKTLTARIKLNYELTNELWPVELESSDLEDALLNLSLNALHAMDSSGNLTISTRNEQLNEMDVKALNLTAGDFVLLCVTDSGCGMEAAIKDKIFDPFFTTNKNQGSGLGLSQVYAFIKRSGGAIKVYSEPKLGSRFVLYLPRSHQTITSIEPTDLELANLKGTETLLVVDDEPDMVDLAYNIFSANGYRVLTANDGVQAMAIVKNNTGKSIDLIITDVIMPNMDGYQLAAQILKDYPQIKIQMVSGFSDERHKGMMDKSLDKNMLYKPYTSNKLLKRIRTMLDEEKT